MSDRCCVPFSCGVWRQQVPESSVLSCPDSTPGAAVSKCSRLEASLNCPLTFFTFGDGGARHLTLRDYFKNGVCPGYKPQSQPTPRLRSSRPRGLRGTPGSHGGGPITSCFSRVGSSQAHVRYPQHLSPVWMGPPGEEPGAATGRCQVWSQAGPSRCLQASRPVGAPHAEARSLLRPLSMPRRPPSLQSTSPRPCPLPTRERGPGCRCGLSLGDSAPMPCFWSRRACVHQARQPAGHSAAPRIAACL